MKMLRLGNLLPPVILAAAGLIPLTGPTVYELHILIAALTYSILAASWDLLFGYTGQLSFGVAGFFGLGAYTSALLNGYFGISPWLGLLVAGITCAAAGLIMGVPTLRLTGTYLALVTLAFSEGMRAIFFNWYDVTNGAIGYSGYSQFPGIPNDAATYYYLVLAIAIVSFLSMHILVNRSRIGLIFKAIREDQVLAWMQGVDIVRYKLLAFVISCFFMGVAGAFFAHYLRVVDPQMMLPASTALFIGMSVVGGVGTIWGALIGGFALEVIYEYVRAFGVYYNLMLVGGSVILMVIFIPQGLWGISHSAYARMRKKWR
jgi:branched-chain amino acid transport system permease protein